MANHNMDVSISVDSCDAAAGFKWGSAQMPTGRGFDPSRFSCDDGELILANGRTYAVSNQWGGRMPASVEALLTAFPGKGISFRPVS